MAISASGAALMATGYSGRNDWIAVHTTRSDTRVSTRSSVMRVTSTSWRPRVGKANRCWRKNGTSLLLANVSVSVVAQDTSPTGRVLIRTCTVRAAIDPLVWAEPSPVGKDRITLHSLASLADMRITGVSVAAPAMTLPASSRGNGRVNSSSCSRLTGG